MISGTGRCFLFLQGPHGPYFNLLGRMLRAAGSTVWRVGFNQGDAAFWFHRQSYIPYAGTQQGWPDWCADVIAAFLCELPMGD